MVLITQNSIFTQKLICWTITSTNIQICCEKNNERQFYTKHIISVHSVKNWDTTFNESTNLPSSSTIWLMELYQVTLEYVLSTLSPERNLLIRIRNWTLVPTACSAMASPRVTRSSNIFGMSPDLFSTAEMIAGDSVRKKSTICLGVSWLGEGMEIGDVLLPIALLV